MSFGLHLHAWLHSLFKFGKFTWNASRCELCGEEEKKIFSHTIRTKCPNGMPITHHHPIRFRKMQANKFRVLPIVQVRVGGAGHLHVIAAQKISATRNWFVKALNRRNEDRRKWKTPRKGKCLQCRVKPHADEIEEEHELYGVWRCVEIGGLIPVH